MSDEKQEINLHVLNYPVTEESEPFEQLVVFGTERRVTVLIEVDVESGDLSVVVGNGPNDDQLNGSLAGMFYELGEMFEGLLAEEK